MGISQFLIQTVLAVLIAGAGWWIVHVLNSKRDLANERRKLRTSYLIDAYRALEDGSNRDDPKPYQAKVESAIADIQLLGTPSQVALAQTFAATISGSGGASLDGLLADLRQSLRAELQLEAIDNEIKFLRFINDV